MTFHLGWQHFEDMKYPQSSCDKCRHCQSAGETLSWVYLSIVCFIDVVQWNRVAALQSKEQMHVLWIWAVAERPGPQVFSHIIAIHMPYNSGQEHGEMRMFSLLTTSKWAMLFLKTPKKTPVFRGSYFTRADNLMWLYILLVGVEV